MEIRTSLSPYIVVKWFVILLFFQRKLERLLQVFPQEPVEAKRWSKIAHALGNRTPKQVSETFCITKVYNNVEQLLT